MVIATTWFHCRTRQRLAPPNVSGSAWNGCTWKSASTGTSRVLMKISLQPSSGFNMLQPISGTSHEIFIPDRDEKNMKKQESVSKPATAVFNGAQLWKKKAKSGLSLEILPAASAQVSRRSWDQKKPGYGMGNNYIKLEQCLILYWVCSPTWLVGCTCYKLYHYIPCKSMYIILYPYITLYNYVCNTILVNNPPTSPPGDIPQQRDHDQLTLHSTTMQSWCEGKCCYEYVGEHLQTSGSLLGSMSIAKLTSIRTVIRSTCEMNGKLTALTTVQESSGCNMAETYESLLYWYQ